MENKTLQANEQISLSSCGKVPSFLVNLSISQAKISMTCNAIDPSIPSCISTALNMQESVRQNVCSKSMKNLFGTSFRKIYGTCVC